VGLLKTYASLESVGFWTDPARRSWIWVNLLRFFVP